LLAVVHRLKLQDLHF